MAPHLQLAGTNPKAADKCPEKLRGLAQNNPVEPHFADGVPLTPNDPPPPCQEEHWVGKSLADGAGARGCLCGGWDR